MSAVAAGCSDPDVCQGEDASVLSLTRFVQSNIKYSVDEKHSFDWSGMKDWCRHRTQEIWKQNWRTLSLNKNGKKWHLKNGLQIWRSTLDRPLLSTLPQSRPYHSQFCVLCRSAESAVMWSVFPRVTISQRHRHKKEPWFEEKNGKMTASCVGVHAITTMRKSTSGAKMVNKILCDAEKKIIHT